MSEDIRYGRKRKGIIMTLTEKIEEWLESIDDEALRKRLKKDVIVTGGSIASMLLGEKINDFDIYFRTKESAIAAAEYYVAKMKTKMQDSGQSCPSRPVVKTENVPNIRGESEERVLIWMQSSGIMADGGVESKEEPLPFEEVTHSEEEQKEPYRVSFISSNAITLTDKVQLIIRFFGEPTEIHSNYDFVHAMCYWDHGKKELNLPAEALEALLSRTLVYRGSLYPIASIFRMKKFIERGWRITAGEQLKIMWQISEIDLTDRDTFVEQLTGVDMAYMYALIEALENVDSEQLTSSYVGKVIEKIFG